MGLTGRSRIEICSIMCGHSSWHDDVWRWLGKHDDLFGDQCLYDLDYINAVGIMIAAGADVEVRREPLLDITLTFNGDIDTFMRRLRDFTRSTNAARWSRTIKWSLQ